jgi:excisionase family DNA binding protein
MEKEVFTIEEAAKFLQLSRRSLYKLVREGEIPCKKILNKWRFARESLKRWVEGGENSLQGR